MLEGSLKPPAVAAMVKPTFVWAHAVHQVDPDKEALLMEVLICLWWGTKSCTKCLTSHAIDVAAVAESAIALQGCV